MNRFECDREKARSNYKKHSVRFTEAGRALNSAPSLTGRSPQSDELGEERNVSIVKLADGRPVVVVWTPRKGNVRIISVRRARKREREALNAYFKNLQ
jgi:uncharacterized DUF497 family protein